MKTKKQKTATIFVEQANFQRQRGSKGMENKRRPPLSPDQCAYCKGMGHWKSECPKGEGNQEEKSKGQRVSTIILSKDSSDED